MTDMNVRFDTRWDQRLAVITPLVKGRGRIVVSQGRRYDPRQMGGSGDWGQPMIEWDREMAATTEDAERMIEGLKEAVRIGRRWGSA
jgi:hypothetical protein